MYDILELPIQSRQELKNAIIQHIKKFGTMKAIRRQLELGLVDLLLQFTITSISKPVFINDQANTASQVNAMPISVDELKREFEGLPIILLEVLNYLAEEIDNERLCLTRTERQEVSRQLEKYVLTVLQFLVGFLQLQQEQNINPTYEDVLSGCLRCVKSWIRLSSNLDPTFLENYPFFRIAFQNLAQKQSKADLFDDSVDVICELIVQTRT